MGGISVSRRPAGLVERGRRRNRSGRGRRLRVKKGVKKACPTRQVVAPDGMPLLSCSLSGRRSGGPPFFIATASFVSLCGAEVSEAERERERKKEKKNEVRHPLAPWPSRAFSPTPLCPSPALSPPPEQRQCAACGLPPLTLPRGSSSPSCWARAFWPGRASACARGLPSACASSAGWTASFRCYVLRPGSRVFWRLLLELATTPQGRASGWAEKRGEKERRSGGTRAWQASAGRRPQLAAVGTARKHERTRARLLRKKKERTVYGALRRPRNAREED